MPRRLVFLRTRRNRNSLAALVVAIEQARPATEVELRFVDSVGELPRGTELLAFSFVTTELDAVRRELAALNRPAEERPLLIAGGAHPSADPEGTLALGFDLVFVGEAERTLPAFLAELDAPPRGPAIRIDRGPPIDLDRQLHVAPAHRQYPFAELSRGCPYRCGFCQVPQLFGRRLRFRSPAVVAEGIALAAERGYRRFRYLTSDAFAYRPRRQPVELALQQLLEGCAAAGAHQQLLGSFPSEVRPDHVTPELLALLRAHCFNRTLVIGAQSGSDRVLKLMRRGHTVAQARAAIVATAEAGLHPHVDILLGYPGESAAEQLDSLALASWCVDELGARIHAHVYLPLPATPAWPAPPEPLARATVAGLKRLEAAGALDGYWEQHIGMGRKILAWRARGLIKV